MTTFQCYYDASGSERQEADPLVVVGILSTADKWRKCEKEWEAILLEFGVPYLHMKEFAHSLGPFALWKGDEAKRVHFLKRLVLALKRRVHMAFQFRLVPSVFTELDKEFEMTEGWGGPYALAASLTIHQTDLWLQEHKPNDDVIHVVEKGDKGQNKLLQVAYAYPSPPILRSKIDPITKRHFMPFQAVDMIAYEAHINIKRGLSGESHRLRGLLAELRRHIPYQAYILDDKVIRRMCDMNPEVFRPRP